MKAFIHQCAVQGASLDTEPVRTAARGGGQAGRSRGARRADRPGWVGEAGREEGAGPPRRESLRGLRQLVCREMARARCRHHTSLGRGKAASVRRVGEDGLLGGCGRRTC